MEQVKGNGGMAATACGIADVAIRQLEDVTSAAEASAERDALARIVNEAMAEDARQEESELGTAELSCMMLAQRTAAIERLRGDGTGQRAPADLSRRGHVAPPFAESGEIRSGQGLQRHAGVSAPALRMASLSPTLSAAMHHHPGSAGAAVPTAEPAAPVAGKDGDPGRVAGDGIRDGSPESAGPDGAQFAGRPMPARMLDARDVSQGQPSHPSPSFTSDADRVLREASGSADGRELRYKFSSWGAEHSVRLVPAGDRIQLHPSTSLVEQRLQPFVFDGLPWTPPDRQDDGGRGRQDSRARHPDEDGEG
ncbi:hypothetical protein SAMN05216345_108200 [Cupriavidus sp. YR651]|uniref:SpaN/EivJ family type III secretion system needle length determinant n=1 Tax=Cupriavidus sp. YR651 TaxID=1855315 RepID=UPI000882E7BB|nr:hypothetical protein [Cupriavidus sp. YR651]SDD38676.1 hypothetical protein SAMN05216345_108200 [Cupriavidus sp. YR651]